MIVRVFSKAKYRAQLRPQPLQLPQGLDTNHEAAIA